MKMKIKHIEGGVIIIIMSFVILSPLSVIKLAEKKLTSI